MHIFATNDITQAKKVIAIQGEAQYSTISQARLGASTEISDILTAGLPMAEWVVLGTLIYEYKTAF